MEALLPLFVVIPLGFAFITALLDDTSPVSSHCHPAGFSFPLRVIGVDDGQPEGDRTELYGGRMGARKRYTGRHPSFADGFSVLLLVIINSSLS
jgi:hypothetical protein